MDSDSNLKLNSQLCFPLYACAKEVVKQYTPFLERIGLTYTQYIAMMVMWEHKSLNVKEIGELLYLDSGTLTPLLKRLESRGLIERKRSEADERRLYVTITDKGELLKEKANEVSHEVRKCINLSPQEIIFLQRILHNILDQVTTKN